MLFRNTLVLALSSAVLIACESTPEPDTTPEIMTSVATSNVRNFGFKGLFATDGTEAVYTNPEMQRQDQQFKFTGDVMSKLGKKQSLSNITRLDKNLVWQMNNRKKRYTECKVVGCGALSSFDQNTFAGSEPVDDEDTCNIKLTELDLSVKRTGQTREINGFPTEEFALNWTMKFADDQNRETVNILTSNTWTTPGDSGASEAVQMQKQFADARAALIAKELGILGSLDGAFPVDAMLIIQRYLIDELPDDIRQKLEQLAKAQAKITGIPISTKVEWNAKAEACGAAEKAQQEEDKSILDTSSLGGLLSSVTKQVAKQKIKKIEDAKRKEIEMAPVFGYVKEITSINMQNVRLSKMQVPSNYKLNNRK